MKLFCNTSLIQARKKVGLIFLFSVPFLVSFYMQAAEIDPKFLQTLNSEANHEELRRRQFKADRDAKKIYDNKREKDLSLFLQDQEKMEMQRLRGLAEHRKQKRVTAPADDGPEFKEDLRLKNKEEQKKEAARLSAVQTRKKVSAKFNLKQNEEEIEEFNLAENRPRYDLRKRGKSKWNLGKSQGAGSAGSGNNSGGFAPPPAAFDDFPTQPDFMQPPPEGFEEIPPPPPPVNYDGSMGFGGIDSGFGDIPPPPPPPVDDDFN